MNQAFAQDVLTGLSTDPKFIPSKYFYDSRGSEIFQQIMNLDEYYLTDCEFEILETYRDQFLELFLDFPQKSFELIELGAGDGLKTKILLRHFLEKKADFKYVPIDISAGAVNGLVSDLRESMPDLSVQGIINDYSKALQQLKLDSPVPKVLLFIGSNIGNFHWDQALGFLKEIQSNVRTGDLMLIGFDLKKNPNIVLKAYNDKKGVTSDFNMNLLRRINRELGGDFDLNHFCHYPVYDPASGSAKSYLMSTAKQRVYIEALEASFDFEAWEAIYTESSFKYTPYMINKMAEACGFQVVKNFYDQKNYYTNSLWRVA